MYNTKPTRNTYYDFTKVLTTPEHHTSVQLPQKTSHVKNQNAQPTNQTITTASRNVHLANRLDHDLGRGPQGTRNPTNPTQGPYRKTANRLNAHNARRTRTMRSLNKLQPINPKRTRSNASKKHKLVHPIGGLSARMLKRGGYR